MKKFFAAICIICLVFTFSASAFADVNTTNCIKKCDRDCLCTTAVDDELEIVAYDGDFHELTELYAINAEASSELDDPQYGRFPAEWAVDGKTFTSWQEGVPGLGEGETITMYFCKAVPVSVIRLYAGHQADAYCYRVNGRPHIIELSFSDGSTCVFEHDDVYSVDNLALSRQVETEYVTIKILSAYDAEWQDTAISEVQFFR